jgi:multisubunit Na+/H+ antiporter MnhG subunit
MTLGDRQYYNDEARAFPSTHECRLTQAQAALVVEGLLEYLDEPRAKIILHRRETNFDRAHRPTREIEFFAPYVTLAAAIHELAHLYFMGHDADHAFLVCLFLEVLKTKSKEEH